MKHIDKVFRDKLYNQEAQVPEGMWDKIAPALEEEKGRAILWIWLMGGILALLIGGLSYWAASGNSPLTGPLAEKTTESQKHTEETKSTQVLAHTLPSQLSDTESAQATKKDDLSNATHTLIKDKKTTKAKVQNVSEEQNASKTSKAPSAKAVSTPIQNKSNASVTPLTTMSNNVTSGVERQEVNDEMKYGKPANLVITKSFISDKGSVVEQLNLSKEDESNAPVYNVFINSEGLNAGALLRIVEPLEILPLPAFQNNLKKKN